MADLLDNMAAVNLWGKMVVGMQHPTLVSCPQQVEVFLDCISFVSFVALIVSWDVHVSCKQLM